MNTKPKKDLSHLKQYQFKKGVRPPGHRPKGSRNYKTELTIELLQDAALIDPETGRRMSAKSLKRKLSRHIWSDARILLNYLDRKLGKVPEKVDQQVTFNIVRHEPKALDTTHTITDTAYEIIEEAKASEHEKDDNNQ